MRRSFDGLAGMASTIIEQDPLDGHLFVFDDVTLAARWAVSVQQQHCDAVGDFQVHVKIGMHVGNPVPHPEDPNDFIGKPLDYAARLTDHATGGQIVRLVPDSFGDAVETSANRGNTLR